MPRPPSMKTNMVMMIGLLFSFCARFTKAHRWSFKTRKIKAGKENEDEDV